MSGFTPTVSVLQLSRSVVAFAQLELDVPGILARAGLSAELLRDPQARISAAAELEVWEAAAEQSGDISFGLRVAELLRPGVLGPFEYLLRNSETVEQLVERAQRFGRLIDDLLLVSVELEGDIATLTVSRSGAYPVSAAGIECLFSVVLSVARETFPLERPLEVRFAHASGARDVAMYRRHFECPVRFGAAAYQILMGRAQLRLAAPKVDPVLGKVLEDHTQHLLDQLPRSDRFAEAAEHALRKLLDRGNAQMDALAHALHVSERTLRRRLQAEGTSYQALLDDIRRTLALERVARDDGSLEHLAESLGFADTSTFYRAFRRWTGTTPAQFRAERRKHGGT